VPPAMAKNPALNRDRGRSETRPEGRAEGRAIGAFGPQLPDDEDGKHGEAGADTNDRVDRAPARVRRLDDAVHERISPCDRKPRADRIGCIRMDIPRLGHERHRTDGPHHHDRQVGEEDRVPGEVVEKPAADDWAQDQCRPGHSRARVAIRLRPLVLVEEIRDDRESGRA